MVRSLGHAGGIRAARTGLKSRQRLFGRKEIFKWWGRPFHTSPGGRYKSEILGKLVLVSQLVIVSGYTPGKLEFRLQEPPKGVL